MKTPTSRLVLYAYFVVMLLIGVHAGISYSLNLNYRAAMRSAYEDMALRVNLANTMREMVRERSTRLHRMIMFRPGAELTKEIASYDALLPRFDEASHRLASHLGKPREIAAHQAMNKLARHGWRMQDQVVKLVMQNEREAARQVLLNTVLPVQDEVLEQVGVFNELQRMQRQQLETELDASFRQSIMLEISLALLTLTLAGIITLILRRKVAAAETMAAESARNLKHYAAGLETAVAARTRELSSARDEAIKANQAKSQFLANMSHELRTPLNAIIGYSEILAEEARDAGQERCVTDLGKIKYAGKSLMELINTLLDVAKIEAGHMPIMVEPFAMARFVAELSDTARPLADKKHNTFSIHLDPTVHTMQTDRDKLRHILLNLLSNACKFTEQGQISLDISPGKEHGLLFKIEDNGIGMDETALARVFEPFTQADASTTRRYGGTGLGLTLAQHYVIMLGGRISVQSRTGKGTCFTIWLPNPFLPVSPQATSGNEDEVDAGA